MNPDTLALSTERLAAAAGVRLNRTDKEKIPVLFGELDTDKNGTLDRDEFKAFLVGRFHVSTDTAIKVFNAFDTNEDNELDIDEFEHVITAVNDLVVKHELEAAKETTSRTACLGYASCCCAFCCLCTAGVSVCVWLYSTWEYTQFMAPDNVKAREEKTNEKITQGIIKFAEKHDRTRAKHAYVKPVGGTSI